ncbi:MAG TPA: hypothetical protein PK664_07930 [Paludibacteraceae bacterium]|mgnify:CR=1 FL=1|nr:hypothetical protein [Paludibacteraceae bacterium]HPS11288.1 hypothetical protein [Paludibacteraceae bacterium]
MMRKKNISLDEMDKRLPFTVPENYFEDFATSMELQISEVAAEKKHRQLKPWVYAVAAVSTGLIIFGSVYTSVFSGTSKPDNYESYVLSQVDETSMLYYYLEGHNTENK